MRIPRPRRLEAPFRRLRTPPPQATKLLTYSMAAGLLFIVILAIVFVPRFLQYSSPCRSTDLQLVIERDPVTNETRIKVNSTPIVLERAAFRAVLYRNDEEIARLDQGLTNGTATLGFVDADGDDAVGSGDYFTLDASVQAQYRLEVILLCDDRLVGVLRWSGALS